MTIIEKIISKNYWLNKLKHSSVVNDKVITESVTQKLDISEQELSYFYKITRENETAEFTLLIALFNTLLNRYFEAPELLFSPNFEEKETALLYKFNSTKGKRFKQFFHEAKQEILEVYKYSDYIGSSIDKGSFKKYTSFGFFYNTDDSIIQPTFPFSININKTIEGLTVAVSYSEDFISKDIANHFLGTFKIWISQFENFIEEEVDKIPIVSEHEENILLNAFNDTRVDHPSHLTIVDLFEKQVNKTPDRPALIVGETELTYRQLNERANELASYLITTCNISQNDFVGVRLKRNEKLVIALLAVLKTGATYVPIDVNYPEERVNYIETDSSCKLIIDKSLSFFKENKTTYLNENIRIQKKTTDLAYVIYTSGTTGNPKGVMVSHQNAVAMIHWAQDEFDSNNFDVVYAVTSHCFDLSIFELFYTLSIGKKIKLLNSALEIPTNLKKDTKVLINTVPSSIRSIIEEGTDLKNVTIINLAGEAFPVDIAEKLLSNTNAEIRNLYGPSEDTTYSTCYKLSKEKNYKSIPVGKPISNTQAYILDDELQLVPVGLPGKLYLSGHGLTKGYLNRQTLTEQRYIANPFKEGIRMYDTGDIAKWMPDGTIEFLGRKDNQVKIRGHRIEIGEIEKAILQFSKDIQQVVVEVKELGSNKELVAYYVATTDIENNEVKAFLKEKLPAYMLPNFYKSLSTIPLTLNGKIDRNALPDITSDQLGQRNYVAPRNELERALVNIWEEVIDYKPIGVTDNFFDLGGHSLVVGQILNRTFKQLNKSISFESFFATPVIEALSKKLLNTNFTAIPKVEVAKSYPLTTAQHRIWVLSQLEGGSLAYNMPGIIRLKGNLDVIKFEEAFKRLIRRHEVLRTYFKADQSGDVFQHVIAKDSFEFNFSKINYLGQAKEKTDLLLKEEHSTAFDLEKGPLLRATVIKTEEEVHVFSLTLHHIISDGWSMELLIAEVIQSYNNLLRNNEYQLPELTIQYKDYAGWLNLELKKEQYKSAEQYWLSQFQGELPVIDLPSFKPRPKVQTYNGKTITHLFSEPFLNKLKQFSKANEATLFMTLMTGLNALLYRYTNQTDLIIGTPIAGRIHPDLEEQLGLYLNTLAIRTTIEDSYSFADLLKHQKQILLSAYEHQNYPLDELINKLNLKRDTSRSALFDVMVLLQNEKQVQSIKAEQDLLGIDIEKYEVERNTSQFDLSFIFVEKQALELSIEYNSDIYDEILIQRMFTHFEKLLSEAIDHSDENLLAIEYVSEPEKRELLEVFNKKTGNYPKGKTLTDLFEEQVEKTPDNIAIVFEDSILTYQQLNEQANQLAHYLRENYDMQAEDLAGIKFEKNEQTLVAVFGILKAGGAYVPIDVNYPQDRIEYIQQDTNCKVVIDQKELDYFKTVKDSFSTENPQKINDANNLAYVIYTSGTTGKPKGVMVEHKNVVSVNEDYLRTYKLDQFEVNLLQLASVSFDVFVGDLCRALLNGGKMIIPSADTKLNPEDLYLLMAKHQVSIFEGTPGFLIPLLNYISENNKDYSFLKLVIFGADSFNNQVFNAFRDKFVGDIKIVNTYGLTEATIDSTIYDHYNSDLFGTTPIGKPFANTNVFILNSKRKLTPSGVFGEVYVGGSGVTRGYHNKPQLTDTRFFKIPFLNEKVYFTGDVARWLPDGNIEFLGRSDHQVKIRGYRIELGEIETAIREYSDEMDQVIVSVKEVDDEKNLVVYYVADNIIDKSNLKNFLQEKLPDYMVPGFFMQLDAFPMTPNEKVDRKKLPEISEEGMIRQTFVAPKNEVEAKLANIWSQLLGVAKVSVTDNFFELGGHSLKITKLRNQINMEFSSALSFNDLFIQNTVAEQAKLITGASEHKYEDIPKLPKQESYALSSAQRRLWVLSQFEGGNTAYNMPGVFLLEGRINKDALEKAFCTLVNRHEALRTVFKEDETGEVRQYILPFEKSKFKFEYDETRYFSASERAIKLALKEEVSYKFDLENESLLNVKLFKISKKRTILAFVIHHIISDGWSIENLTNELFTLYNAYKNGEENPLQPLAIQYKDYASWEKNKLTQNAAQVSENYWRNRFSGEIPILEFPTAKRRPLYKTYDGKSIVGVIPQDSLSRLKEICQSNDCTLFMGLVARVKLLLYKYTNQKDIIIGTPIAGREHSQLQNQIGAYINTLALRTQFNGDDTFEELLEKVKATTLEAYNHQSYPFDKLVEELPLRRDLSRNPLFDIMVTLQNTDNEAFEKNIAEGLLVKEYKLLDDVASKVDLELIFEEVGDEMKLNFIYNPNVFETNFIEKLYLDLNLILKSSLGNPDVPLYQLPFLENSQKYQQVHEFNGAMSIEYKEEETFLHRFKSQVEKQGNAIAVIDKDQQISYKELDVLTDKIAHFLNKDLGNEQSPVGILLDRSINTIIILLGVLKSGRAYIPLDPTFPVERLKYIIEHSELDLLISDDVLSEVKTEKIKTFTVAEVLEKSQNLEGKGELISKGSDTAYIIYTSGSTGNPKGVEIGHQSLLNFLLSIQERPGINNTDVLFAVTTYSFDISILEFFAPLISGASVYVASNETLGDPETILKELDDVNPTILQATPSFYQLLFNAGWEGNKQLKILCGGDSLSEPLASKLLASGKELWNMYGPTETTIWSSIKKVEKACQFNIIGKPIANTSLFVLNEFQELMPLGALGHLYIGGDGLAKGYYKDKNLTDKRFIKNQFGVGHIYETGDMVKWTANGELVFFGRNDSQVKIRGYRIELGEIEIKINTLEDVEQAIVIAKKDASGYSVLIAYYIGQENINNSTVRAQLKKILPDYMIPTQFIKLGFFPLTPNKKIDRLALSKLDDLESMTTAKYIPPATEIEAKLAKIWNEILGIKRTGLHDNFFELGGHSLIVTRLISLIQKEFQLKISMNKIFEHPTLEEQSLLIENLQFVNQKNDEQGEETKFKTFSI